MSLVNGPYKIDLVSQTMGPIEANINGQVADPPSPERLPRQTNETKVFPH